MSEGEEVVKEPDEPKPEEPKIEVAEPVVTEESHVVDQPEATADAEAVVISEPKIEENVQEASVNPESGDVPETPDVVPGEVPAESDAPVTAEGEQVPETEAAAESPAEEGEKAEDEAKPDGEVDPDAVKPESKSSSESSTTPDIDEEEVEPEFDMIEGEEEEEEVEEELTEAPIETEEEFMEEDVEEESVEEEEIPFVSVFERLDAPRDLLPPLEITEAMLKNISVQLGQIRLCWPKKENVSLPTFMTNVILPDGYLINTNKEKLLLLYAENFRQQYHSKFTNRKPLLLAADNVVGQRKMVCTALRPTTLSSPKLSNWEELSSFVADHIAYEPMYPPTDLELKKNCVPSIWRPIEFHNCTINYSADIFAACTDVPSENHVCTL